MLGRVAHRTQLHFRRARGHANHHTQRGREQAMAGMHHPDESAHHLLTGREVGYHTIPQRAHGANIIMCLFIHHLGSLAHGNHLVRMAVQSYYRRLVDNNLVITDNDCVGRSKIHCNFLHKTKKTHYDLLFDDLLFTIYFANQLWMAVS